MWCSLCQEARKEEIMKIQYIEYRRKNAIVRKVLEWEKREILYLKYSIGKKRVCRTRRKQYVDKGSKRL